MNPIPNDSNSVFDDFYDWLHKALMELGFQNEFNRYAVAFSLSLILFIIVCVVLYIVRFILRGVMEQMVKRTNFPIFKYLRKHSFPHNVALLAPVPIALNAIPYVFRDFQSLHKMAANLVKVYIIFVIIRIIMSIIKSFFDILRERPAFKYKPMSSWSQVIHIIFLFIGCVFSYMIITGNDITTLAGVLGATSAVLLLIFKDTIMGFVASITVATNDMVRLGDWITMPEYNADGDVIEINLNTVKVQNFDKTITTIPTYKLIQNSFQNWRGMENSGGRRIKRSINIIQSTVRFIPEKELEKFLKIQGIKDYIIERQNEINQYNKENKADKNFLVNGRNFTNLGLFRKYVEIYLDNHPRIDHSKTQLVRQLAPTSKGIPVEVYAFTNTTIWREYEEIQSDIFDHLIAAIKYFDLKIFEDLHNKIDHSVSQDTFDQFDFFNQDKKSL
ncbi:mechanosensitive ion channel family protein [Ornithobacterium rhinotracheale]|uniref:mechanosensitive ion channel family protein n=1 Tax=Ornithobacterium rhinotracheale TaxID=28251 RepID=UPI001FBA0C95|nr:mechanosensitive ion channel domain-containing protein [Ornithobacterium rhinotracheale]UOH76844.1 mechanosensitive ion channel family protein [Ornithobacterium rhinotracheale]